MSELRKALEKYKLDVQKMDKELEENQNKLAECEKKYVEYFNDR